MSKWSRSDGNQAEIVRELRAHGVSVFITNAVGRGFPDLVAGYRGRNFLLECKRSPKGKLSQDQETFRAIWTGQWARVNNSIEALEVVGVL